MCETTINSTLMSYTRKNELTFIVNILNLEGKYFTIMYFSKHQKENLRNLTLGFCFVVGTLIIRWYPLHCELLGT